MEEDAFLHPLFEEPSKPVGRTPVPVCRPLFDISLPVTLEEYERALGIMHESCPGHDRVDRWAIIAADFGMVNDKWKQSAPKKVRKWFPRILLYFLVCTVFAGPSFISI